MIFADDLEKVSWQCVHYTLYDDFDSLRETLRASSLITVEANFSDVVSDGDLFKKVSDALKFPDYFGNNWDALDECLSDMEWLPSKGYVLFIIGSDLLWKNATYTVGKFVSAWLAAAEQWSQEDTPFHLVFVLSK